MSDPELYEDCPHDHKGDIEIFGRKEYQARFQGFAKEIEKYPEFQFSKTFDWDILKDVDIVENDKEAVKQMNRLLKIILSILIVYKPVLNKKISSMPDVGIDERNLRKPYFGSQQWGPLYKNIDIGDEEDSSRLYSDQQFLFL